MSIIKDLKNGLIVSCQAKPDNPLRETKCIAALAEAAAIGGASGIRADNPENIAAIKKVVNVPIIGIYKSEPSENQIYITPSLDMAKAAANAGADIIAFDATNRPRPDGSSLENFINSLRKELDCLLMADISTFEEGVEAAILGVDIVATTLSGYTSDSKSSMSGPDLDLVERLASAIDVPVICEGRLMTLDHIKEAFRCGAYAVVIGKAITNPIHITQNLKAGINEYLENENKCEGSESVTENINPDSVDIDRKPLCEILSIINENDKKVPLAVSKALPEIEKAVDMVLNGIRNGGRLFYVGSGTSGRLAFMDAAECPPTYGVDHDLIQVIMSGGQGAVFKARESSEDDASNGAATIRERGVLKNDVVFGISASGRTPFVEAALEEAGKIGASTIVLINNHSGPICKYADLTLNVVCGPEVVTGSTRMKAGSADKMVLNMISTAVMIKLGKVTGNLMTNIKTSNIKLRDRAINMIAMSAKIDKASAAEILEANDGNLKKALIEAKEIK